MYDCKTWPCNCSCCRFTIYFSRQGPSCAQSSRHPFCSHSRVLLFSPSRAADCCRDLAEEIDLSQIDDFVAAPAENCFEHEQAEALHLLKGNRRRHGELLPTHDDFDQSRSVMLESLRDHGLYLIRCFGRQPKETRGLRHLCKIWVVQVCSKIEDTGCLHFQFDKGQRVVLEDNHLDRQLQLPKREQIAHEHRETAVSGQRDDLAAR